MQELQRTTGTLFNVPACLQCLTKHGDGPWIVPGCQDGGNRLPMSQVPRVLMTVPLHFAPGLNQAWMNETLPSGGGAIQFPCPPLGLRDHVPDLVLLSSWGKRFQVVRQQLSQQGEDSVILVCSYHHLSCPP